MATHILSLSYGKDSLACLGAIEKLGWPLDGIVHAEIWATDTIPADLPPMVEFKAKADKIIKKRWGIEVKRFHALDTKGNKKTYESIFYKKRIRGKNVGEMYGFPMTISPWCVSDLKKNVIYKMGRHIAMQQESNSIIRYVGIAADEPKRLERLDKSSVSPLVAIGWNEADCRKWCEDNNLLSPIYTTTARGGCWFCHNQSLDQLRFLRKTYPDLWALLLKWDKDSPLTFRTGGTLYATWISGSTMRN